MRRKASEIRQISCPPQPLRRLSRGLGDGRLDVCLGLTAAHALDNLHLMRAPLPGLDRLRPVRSGEANDFPDFVALN